MNEKAEPKSDMEVLFPDVEIEGYKIRPWGLEQIADLSPVLLKVIKAARDAGVDWPTKSIDSQAPELILAFGSYAPEILAKTLKIDEAEARALPLDKAAIIMLTVITQNLDYLKNSLGLESLINRIKESLSGP